MSNNPVQVLLWVLVILVILWVITKVIGVF